MLDFIRENLILFISLALTLLSILTFTLFFIFKGKVRQRVLNYVYDMHTSNDGQISWTRSISTVVVLFALFLCLYQEVTSGEINETVLLGLLGIAFGGKVTQRLSEKLKK